MLPQGGGMEIKMIYLDNASTTKPSENVKKAVYEAMENFGNPSSMHRLGMNSEGIIKKARENAARVISVNPGNIYFTSGGTESNNTAILGYCRQNRKKGMHIITTAVEHPSVLTPFKMLQDEGFCVTYLKPDKYGVISLQEFENALTDDTIFVSIMAVNNEIGSVMPIDKLKFFMKQKSPKAVLHVDAVQAYGKIPIKPKQWGIDLLSASGHKIHGIKGTGILYIADNINISPLINGGGQQKNIRSGTENVVGIAAFSQAAEDILSYDITHICELRNYLKKGISENIDRIKINESKDDTQTGYILNVSFLGLRSEILLHSLEMHDIYVSTGSACSTNKPAPSHVLSAIGCSHDEIDSAVRFSFSDELTFKDMDYVIEALKQEVFNIRKYVRK